MMIIQIATATVLGIASLIALLSSERCPRGSGNSFVGQARP
jgi:hypothetical protein